MQETIGLILSSSQTSTMVPMVSVGPYLSLLSETEPELQEQALIQLDGYVDQFWMEIADYVSTVCVSFVCAQVLQCSEMLYEDDKFPKRQLAALLLSKVFLIIVGVV
jgi:26S proteasome regulatory subunit N2